MHMCLHKEIARLKTGWNLHVWMAMSGIELVDTCKVMIMSDLCRGIHTGQWPCQFLSGLHWQPLADSIGFYGKFLIWTCDFLHGRIHPCVQLQIQVLNLNNWTRVCIKDLAMIPVNQYCTMTFNDISTGPNIEFLSL